MSRDSVIGFQDFLNRAREIEMSIKEHKVDAEVASASYTSMPMKTTLKCGFCRKKNHSTEQCLKRIEFDKKGKGAEESKLSCYGCGAAGYYKTNCPTCNNTNALESPKRLDFHAINNTILGRDNLNITINVSGIKDTTCLDTGDRSSIAAKKN